MSKYEEVIENYMKDPYMIFENQLEIRKIIFKNLPKWKSSTKCIFRGCKNNSIKNSHTISKASLQLIADEDRRLLTPKTDQSDDTNMLGSTYIDEISVDKATSFPGFCQEKHEYIFDYERAAKLTSEIHYIKQIYRTICLVYRKQEYVLKQFKTQRTNFIKQRNNKLLKLITPIELIKAGFSHKDTSPNLPVSDWIEEEINDNIKTTKQKIISSKKLLDAFSDEIENKQSDLAYIKVLEIDRTLPIALCGIWTINIGLKTELDIIVNIIPEINGSKLIVSGLNTQSKDIESFLSMYNDMGIFGFLNLIEACMVFGLNEWYIQPKVWNRIDENIKSKILNDIDSVGHGHEYNYSIFNDLRKELINIIKLKIKEKEFRNKLELQKYYDLIINEEKKMK